MFASTIMQCQRLQFVVPEAKPTKDAMERRFVCP